MSRWADTNQNVQLMKSNSWLATNLVGLTAIVLYLNASAVTFTVSPAAVNPTYTGLVTFSVGGLTNGEPVVIQRYLDGNNNGVLDSGEPVIDSFRVSDGGVPLIGGATNINVAFDQNAASGAITASISIAPPAPLQNMVGSYIYRLTSPFGNFSPTNVLFAVTNASLAQSLRGTVYNNGTTPVPGAAVVVMQFEGQGNGGGRYVGGAVTDASGHYQLNLSPGTYVVIPALQGYFTDQSLAQPVSVAAGLNVTNNLFVTNGTASVSGSILDNGNSSGISGVLVMLSSDNLFGTAFTDTNGNFTVSVTSGSWKIKTESDQLARRAYVIPQQNPQFDTTTGNVANATIRLSKANAMFFGTFTNLSGVPIRGLSIRGEDWSGVYQAGGATDANGNYCVAVLGGTNTWYCSPDNSDPLLAGYICTSNPSTNLNVGQALRLDFTAMPASNHIVGVVKDSGNHPVTNTYVNASAMINGVNFNSTANTDQNGNYSMLVANGIWNLNLDCNYINSLGFNCPGNQTTNISGADAVVNFIVSTLFVTTTVLPDGTNGVPYSQSLSASGGQPPYTWMLSPGSAPLPQGLTLSTNGVVSGTATASSFFMFSARVMDSQGATADQWISLNVQPAPLQIVTTALPGATNGVFYYQQLFASGGNPPYGWYMPAGSAGWPSGLSLTSAGVIAGAPMTNGQFNLPVAVFVNNPYQAVTQYLALTIARAPLQVTTVSPLPNATLGIFYSQLLSANGGLPPYSWSLAPGSGPLPPGLSLASNGSLSGTPTSTGPFGISVRVIDAAQGTNDWFLALSVNLPAPPPVVLTAPTRTLNGEFQFGFSTLSGTHYTIQSATAASGPWTSVLTLVGSGNPMTIIDPNSSGPQRYYRLKIGP